MRYHFKIHKEGKGFWAECTELQGCQTQAASREQLDRRMVEVLNLYLDEPQESPVFFPFPDKDLKGASIVEVKVEPKVALAYLLRAYRHINGWTQSQAQKAIGLKGLWSYQRLEKAKTANPQLETLVMIKKTYPKFNMDDIFA